MEKAQVAYLKAESLFEVSKIGVSAFSRDRMFFHVLLITTDKTTIRDELPNRPKIQRSPARHVAR